MSKNSVSIVIVNWNGLKWLKRLLDTVIAQDYEDYEVIFVDNDSTDDSVTYVKQHYPGVKIIQNDKNAGFAGGNNLGIRHAKKEWVMLLNTDTWVKPDLLKKLIAFAIQGGYDVVAPQEADYDSMATRPMYSTTVDVLGHPVYLKGDANRDKNFYLVGICLLFRAHLYKETGGLDNNFFMYVEEIDWFWRLALLDKKIGYCRDQHVYHKGAGSTGKGMNYNVFLWRNQNELQMLIKNYKWYTLALFIPIYILQNFIEVVAFVLSGRGNLAKTYIEGWAFNIKHLKRTLKMRKITQKMRTRGDLYILARMYKGLGKPKHLLEYVYQR